MGIGQGRLKVVSATFRALNCLQSRKVHLPRASFLEAGRNIGPKVIVSELYQNPPPPDSVAVPIVLPGDNIEEMKEGTRVEISRNSTVLQNPNHLYCALGEEAVLLNLGDGIYYGLDPVGARIWALLREAKPVHVLCEILLGEFDVESDRCETEVLALLQELADSRLVEVQ